jgi:hypothetical protein
MCCPLKLPTWLSPSLSLSPLSHIHDLVLVSLSDDQLGVVEVPLEALLSGRRIDGWLRLKLATVFSKVTWEAGRVGRRGEMTSVQKPMHHGPPLRDSPPCTMARPSDTRDAPMFSFGILLFHHLQSLNRRSC